MSLEKVLETEALVEAIQTHQRQGQRVVTTNGCFDVLHVGHLRYLQAAKQLGDILVVLVNSDASVQALKGPNRPILPQEERAEILAGLDCVDYVGIFHQDTPIDVLERLRPHIHVKGGDYDVKNLPEAPVLEGMGTELVFIPTIEGRSTTNIIQRILTTYQPA